MFNSLLILMFPNGITTLCLVLLLLVTLALLLHVTVYRKNKRFTELASQIPGPKWYPFIGSAYTFGTNPKDILQNIADITEKYKVISGHWVGPVYYVTLQKAHDIEVVLSSNTMIYKTAANELMKDGIGEGLIASSGELWRKHRRYLNPTFNNQAMERYFEIFHAKMETLADVLAPHSDTPELDIIPFVQNCVYDILCETMISTKSNLQNSTAKQNKYIEYIIEVLTIVHNRMFKPWMYVGFIFKRTSSGRTFKKEVAYLTDFINEAIERRRKELKIGEKQTINENGDDTKSDRKKGVIFLDYTLEHAKEGNFSDQEIVDETCNNMFAGFDSVASGIAYVIYVLSKRFDIQEKLVEEMQEVLGTLEDKPYTLKELNSLKYLDRVTKEVLRLLSPVPYLARQITEETKLPSGYTLPNGSAVIVMIFRVHRDPSIYPDPDVFDPDHFLPERCASRPAYGYCPFSLGPRNCIGHKFSMLEIKMATISLLRRYWLTPVDMTLDLANKLNLFTINGVKVGLQKRTVDRPVVKNYDQLSKGITANVSAYNLTFKESYA